MYKLIFTVVILFLSILLLSGSSTKIVPKRPNILVIMADDLGFSDLACYGGEIHTPNIDYLAKNGLRYTQFYNTSRCCPTRASLLTGLYNHQAGIGRMTGAESAPGYLGRLSENAVTLAEILKSAGYHTAMSGKWHVSNTSNRKSPQEQMDWLNHQRDFGAFSPISQYPTNRGFDKFFGTIWGVIDFYDPFSLVSGTEPIRNVPDNYYHTDAINDTAVAYIKEYAGSSQPFFLYVAENAPHWPLQALPEDIAKYENTYKAGWDVIRQARYERMKKLGLIDPKTKLPASGKDEISWENNPAKEWDAKAMAVHAAMIDRMDQGIGRIIAALKQTGELENTLIIFLSDNGASAENCAAYGPGFDRPGKTRDGRTIIYPTKKEVMPGPQTSFASIGPRWANVANTPYRYWKEESYEGGVHTPMIAYWPGAIKNNKGGFSAHVGHVMDFMNTFIELSGATYPKLRNGQQVPPSTGMSLVRSFSDRKSPGHDVLFNEHFGARYARLNNWKLVATKKDSVPHLFNLAEDRTEINDLSRMYPEKAKELDSLWRQWASTHQVMDK